MKSLKDFESKMIEDNSKFSIKGGCSDGTETELSVGDVIVTGDWYDEGTC